jgi:hypothetical protein
MENILYNILWIDDEHETLGGTKGRAKRNGINLIGYKSLNSGMSELERNYPFYDGVLLDAKFFENDDDVKGSEDTENVHRAKERLLSLKKKFEVFVLTGQAEAYDDGTFKKAFPKVFRKGKDEEIDRLFVEIIESASKQEDTQLRQSYKRVFDVCTDKYIGEYAGLDILTLLKVDDETNIDNHFNTIRKIIEDLFSTFHKFNLLPAEFVKPNISLNQSSLFLSGLEQHERTDDKYKKHRHLLETHLPSQIAFYIKNILAVTQSGSHRSNIDDHVQLVRTPYLMKSIFYQVLDVLVWFKMYVDSKPKTENWERIESAESTERLDVLEELKGEVFNLNLIKGFAFFKPETGGDNIFIPPHLVSEFNLKDEMPIKATPEEYVDNRSGENRKRIKNIQIP